MGAVALALGRPRFVARGICWRFERENRQLARSVDTKRWSATVFTELSSGTSDSGRRIHSVTWRSVLGDLIVRGLCRPGLLRIAAPNPTMPVRDHLRVENPAGSGRHQALPLHDKHVFDRHVGCTAPAPPKRAVTGTDRGTMEPRKPSARSSGFTRGIPVFSGLPLPLGVIQR